MRMDLNFIGQNPYGTQLNPAQFWPDRAVVYITD